jgi:hypothetical protein
MLVLLRLSAKQVYLLVTKVQMLAFTKTLKNNMNSLSNSFVLRIRKYKAIGCLARL